MIVPYLYGRNNQYGLNGVSRALHNRYLEGAFNAQFRLPELRRALKIIAAIEDPPVIVKILSHLGLPTRAPPRALARRVDLFQTIGEAQIAERPKPMETLALSASKR